LAWVVQTIDAAGTVGSHTALALDANGRPHIGYYAQTGGDLKYAHWNGTSWVRQVVASPGDNGTYCDIALDGAGNPKFSYYDIDDQDLLYSD
jgi:hypothetical protein